MKLSLSYPARPWIVNQKWGNPNDDYIPLGFSRHNGIDFQIEKDGIVVGMCDGIVTEVGYDPSNPKGKIPNGAGNYIRYRTGLVECEGTTCYVEFMYMHAEKPLVDVGDNVTTGTPLIVADNTGFSTGPHTHISSYRIGLHGERLDTDKEVGYTFDFSKYLKTRFPRDLFFGCRGDDVLILQEVLIKLGWLNWDCNTGFFGMKTVAAISRFQRSYSIVPAFGYFGSRTKAMLENIG